MARVRPRGAPPEIPPPTRGPEGTQLAALLRARRFRLGAGTERVARNLAAHGGEVAADAAPYLGSVRVPVDAPSVSLGEYPGTLGPYSFGFLNNGGRVAAFDAPLPSLPLQGGLALLVPRRDALPDVVPLALARGLRISWIVSVGDGDPAEALAFLGADPMTDALAVVLGAGARGPTLRSAIGLKPTVVLGGDAVCRAVARRAGALVVDGLDGWLARAALLDAGVEPGDEVSVIVVGGGRAYVENEVQAAGLTAEVVGVDERSPEELERAIGEARQSGKPVVMVAGGPPVLPSSPDEQEQPALRVLSADLRHPEHLRALLGSLAMARAEADDGKSRARVDKELLQRVHEEVDRDLSDHDAKRLFKAYGARVSRQAPTSTPTGANKLARTIGLPVLLVSAQTQEERVAESMPDVKRVATLMLQEPSPSDLPASIFVRERFPEVPRVRVKVALEKQLGLMMRVGEACALLPLTPADAATLAASTAARRSADQRALAELLGKLAACAVAEDALFEAEIWIGADPAVIRASASLKNRG
jgi:hypothetical protein